MIPQFGKKTLVAIGIAVCLLLTGSALASPPMAAYAAHFPPQYGTIDQRVCTTDLPFVPFLDGCDLAHIDIHITYVYNGEHVWEKTFSALPGGKGITIDKTWQDCVWMGSYLSCGLDYTFTLLVHGFPVYQAYSWRIDITPDGSVGSSRS